ncbi:hypothetical protein HRbin41_01415 [bacterium HR41]|nr:hypothetical protein HRbin41_01415 [bacterium HR41]
MTALLSLARGSLEPVETGFHHAPVLGDAGRLLLEASRAKRAAAHAADLPGRHEPCILEDADVLPHPGDGHAEALGQVADRGIASSQVLEDSATISVREGGEGHVCLGVRLNHQVQSQRTRPGPCGGREQRGARCAARGDRGRADCDCPCGSGPARRRVLIGSVTLTQTSEPTPTRRLGVGLVLAAVSIIGFTGSPKSPSGRTAASPLGHSSCERSSSATASVSGASSRGSERWRSRLPPMSSLSPSDEARKHGLPLPTGGSPAYASPSAVTAPSCVRCAPRSRGAYRCSA